MRPVRRTLACCLLLAAGCSNKETPVHVCGDGTLDVVEDCDDGNVATGDGCDASCKVEDGWTCDLSSSPTACAADPQISLAGTAAMFPFLNGLLTGGAQNSIEGTDLAVAVYGLVSLEPVVAGDIDTTGCGTSGASACAFQIDDIDPLHVANGWFALLDDSSAASSDTYFPTMSYAAGKAALGAATDGGTVQTKELWALTNAAVGQLAALIGAANGETWDIEELSCRGFDVGFAVASSDSGTSAAEGIVLDTTGRPVDVYYFDGAAASENPLLMFTGTETDSSGLFVIVGRLPAGDEDGVCSPGDVGGSVAAYVAANADGTLTCASTYLDLPGEASTFSLPCSAPE